MWIDELKSSDLVTLLPYMTLNKNLTNFSRIQFSVAYNEPDEMLTRDRLVDVVRNEFNMAISSNIMKEFKSTSFFDYIDMSTIQNMSTNDLIKMCELFYQKSVNHKNAITNVNLGSSLQDSSRFIIDPILMSTMTNKFSSLSYYIGKFSDLDVWIDPVLEWVDTVAYLFDNIEINIGNFSSRITNQATFTPRVIFELEMDFQIVNPKMLFVLTDKTSKSYSRYKSLQRDIKINDVLDEED